jgi:hypothetical protein
MRVLFCFWALMFGLVGCTQKDDQEKNLFQNRVELGGENAVLSENGLSIHVSTVNQLDSGASLAVGYPLGLIGESSLFGAVITKVSPQDDEYYGGLKLGNFLNSVRTQLRVENGSKFVDVMGCRQACTETSEILRIVSIPVLEIDDQNQIAKLDLAALGQTLNIFSYFQDGESDGSADEKWEHVLSRVVTVEFSYSTLVFDVESEFKHITKDADKVNTTDVKMTSRWFIRLSSALSPYFEARKPVEAVGYFQTDSKSSNQFIQRFGIYDLKNRPVKYFIKNVPQEFRAAFAGSFEDWNSRLYPVLGRNLLTYEFVETSDPRYEKIVTGDIRYNVLEWDLENVAGYGGLGPSLAHPLTGEILSAQTLVQGPKVLELYRAWFNLPALQTLAIGPMVNKSTKNLKGMKAKISVNGAVDFTVPAQDPRYHDPVGLQNGKNFVEIPDGYSYATYMDGYFRDMVAHELGHNLGLRHNFKGNLGDTGTRQAGSVSRSVMEYLNRSFRHLDRVGDYDVMAIAYGYLGITPAHSDWYCTDEDSDFGDPTHSAECSSSDGSADPFAYLERQMTRVVDKLLNRGTTEAPTWAHEELQATYPSFLMGMAQYAIAAPLTSGTWTNFFGKLDRPKVGVDVPEYVMKRIAKVVCDESLDKEIQNKVTSEGKAMATENLKMYRKGVLETLKEFNKPWPLVSPANMSCLF